MSFKFGKDIFITFEMSGVAYSRPVDKIHISLQFRPSVIRGPCLDPRIQCKGRLQKSPSPHDLSCIGHHNTRLSRTLLSKNKD